MVGLGLDLYPIDLDDPYTNTPVWLRSRVERVFPRLQAFAQDDLDVIGGGSFGVSFATGDGRRVLKVTTDVNEVAVVANVMANPRLRDHPGVVRYDDVRAVPGGKRPCWALLMERALPLEEPFIPPAGPTKKTAVVPNPSAFDWALEHLEWARSRAVQILFLTGVSKPKGSWLKSEVYHEMKGALGSFTPRELLSRYTVDWYTYLREAWKYPPARNVVGFVMAVKDEFGLMLADVRHGNLGQRASGDWVCFDLGFTPGLTVEAARVLPIPNPMEWLP